MNREADKRASHLITQSTQQISDVLTGSECFYVKFRLQVKEGSFQYQTPPRRVAYALQEPLMEELEWLQKQQIIVPLGVNETSE